MGGGMTYFFLSGNMTLCELCFAVALMSHHGAIHLSMTTTPSDLRGAGRNDQGTGGLKLDKETPAFNANSPSCSQLAPAPLCRSTAASEAKATIT